MLWSVFHQSLFYLFVQFLCLWGSRAISLLIMSIVPGFNIFSVFLWCRKNSNVIVTIFAVGICFCESCNNHRICLRLSIFSWFHLCGFCHAGISCAIWLFYLLSSFLKRDVISLLIFMISFSLCQVWQSREFAA